MWYETWSLEHDRPIYVNSETRETSVEKPATFLSSVMGYDVTSLSRPSRKVAEATALARRRSNAAKRRLIEHAAARFVVDSIRVLDVACGKGGDLWKWKGIGKVSQYVGIDSSHHSIEEAKRRHAKVGSFPAKFQVLDARKNLDWAETFEGAFDIVSVQFALHYFFSSQEGARSFLGRAYRACKKGGTLIATIPCADVVLPILKGEMQAPPHMRLYTDMSLSSTSSCLPIPYIFSFEGSVPGIPEFTIPKTMLLQICQDTGWQPVMLERFNTLYDSYIFTKRHEL